MYVRDDNRSQHNCQVYIGIKGKERKPSKTETFMQHSILQN